MDHDHAKTWVHTSLKCVSALNAGASRLGLIEIPSARWCDGKNKPESDHFQFKFPQDVPITGEPTGL
jgi:hypothetical protein